MSTDHDVFEEWIDKMRGSGIPDYMHEGLARYLTHGIRPGSFLTAVLSNDLKEACLRADDTNRRHIFDYVVWLYSDAPIGSWGSVHAVKSWIKQHASPAQPAPQEREP